MIVSQRHTTAILIFANSAKEELRHKPIARGEILFDELTKHTLQTIKKMGVPYFLFTEKEQSGATFGERFINAIKDVFDLGYENVITVGNDTPHLRVSHIIEAQAQLEANKFVIGPSADGGFYLMGLKKSCFDSISFKNLPWQTSGLYREINKLITTSNVEVYRLNTLFDVDNINDAKALLRISKILPGSLFKTIQRLLADKMGGIGFIPVFLNRYLVKTFHNKGSPSTISLGYYL